MKPISVVANLVHAAAWLARTLATAAAKFVNQPITIAMRLHNMVFAVLLIAFVFAEAWGFAKVICGPIWSK